MLFIIDSKNFVGVKCDQDREFKSNRVILACGHSAKDLFDHIIEAGVYFEGKSFASTEELTQAYQQAYQANLLSQRGRPPAISQQPSGSATQVNYARMGAQNMGLRGRELTIFTQILVQSSLQPHLVITFHHIQTQLNHVRDHRRIRMRPTSLRELREHSTSPVSKSQQSPSQVIQDHLEL